MIDRTALRLSATLLLVGQIVYIAVTQLHAGGEANNHPSVFAVYAGSDIWTAVHLGQFVGMAVLIAGLLVLFFALEFQAGIARWAGLLGVASAVAALALYGVLQAVDGVALKQAVNAWASAPEAEKSARFASAEAVRWIEWGARSYHDYALGLTLLLFAVATARTAWVPRPPAYLMGPTGITYLLQGWVAGAQGFSPTQSILIVLAWLLSLVWMIWLSVDAWRMRSAETRSPVR
jgi:hypothetical protein